MGRPSCLRLVCTLNFRRVLRLRGTEPRDAGDATAAAEEEGEGGDDEGEAEYVRAEKRGEEDGGRMDTDDCHVCPGTEAPPSFSAPPFRNPAVDEISMLHNRDAAERRR